MSTKTIMVMSSDGESFELNEAVASQSVMIKQLLEDTCSDVIRLANVRGNIFSMVSRYCQVHRDDADGDSSVSSSDRHKKFDAGFMANKDQSTIFELVLAANYLDIKGLLDLTCQAVADMIKGKTPDEIRALFNVENDFTPEEEAETRRENQWVF